MDLLKRSSALSNKVEQSFNSFRPVIQGKDSTEMAIKYPTWKQAEGSGLESIKKKIVFTGVKDGLDNNGEINGIGDEINIFDDEVFILPLNGNGDN